MSVSPPSSSPSSSASSLSDSPPPYDFPHLFERPGAYSEAAHVEEGVTAMAESVDEPGISSSASSVPSGDQLERVKERLREMDTTKQVDNLGFTHYKAKIIDSKGRKVTITAVFSQKEMRAFNKEFKKNHLDDDQKNEAMKEKIFDQSIKTYLVWELHAQDKGVTSLQIFDKDIVSVFTGQEVSEQYPLYGRVQKIKSEEELGLNTLLDELTRLPLKEYSRKETDAMIKKLVHGFPYNQSQMPQQG